jgi:hypothetical protein
MWSCTTRKCHPQPKEPAHGCKAVLCRAALRGLGTELAVQQWSATGLASGRTSAALHVSKLVFARSFSLSFLLTKVTRRFTSHRRLWFFLSASTTEETAH